MPTAFPLLLVLHLACGPHTAPGNTAPVQATIGQQTPPVEPAGIPELDPTASAASGEAQAPAQADTLEEAERLLQGTTSDGPLGESALQTAARALTTLRQQDATAAALPVRTRLQARVLLLGPSDELQARLVELDAQRAEGSETITAPTGFTALDDLNTALGASGFRCRMKCRIVQLEFSSPVDILGAAPRYTALGSLRYAEPNYTMGDGSGILLTEAGDVWRLEVYQGRGDCPAGCIDKHRVFYDYDPVSGVLTRTGEEEGGAATPQE